MSHTTYRNRHSRSEQHFGAMEATLVEISSALGVDIPVGMTLDAAIAVVNARISRLENADVHVFGLKADAVKLESFSGSFTADAWLNMGGTFTADAYAVISVSGSFTADAIQKAGSGELTFSADAWVALRGGTIDADAVIKGTISGSLTANAWIGDPPAAESILGQMQLGNDGLGG